VNLTGGEHIVKIISRVVVIFLLVSLIIGVGGCGGKATNEIKIGVIGPMQFEMGKQHWEGATLAADEINAAGGVKVGDVSYQIKLVQVDSNELVSPADAASAAERAITDDKVGFLVGTIRSEAALAVHPGQQ
jgi:branched-chain amino acid transport system substrate-binding protein